MKQQDLILIAAAAAILFLVMRKTTASMPVRTTVSNPVRSIAIGEPNGWQYFTDGTSISPTGVYYYQGSQVYDPAGMYGS